MTHTRAAPAGRDKLQGFNDDWKLSTAWVQSLGGKQQYAEVKARFVEFYWGGGGRRGNVSREKWLLPRAALRRLAKKAELAIFTGRVAARAWTTRWTACKCAQFFKTIVTADDVASGRSRTPEGLHKILDGPRSSERALYIGDNVDDALAGQSAGEDSLCRHPAARARDERRCSAVLCCMKLRRAWRF